jgi:hypothetical protein
VLFRSTEEPKVDNNSGTHTDGDTKPKVGEDDLKSLVSQTISALEQEKIVSKNVAFVSEELAKTYGTDATAFVQKKAQELGMSVARLEEIAKESPTAFFTLIGEPKKEIPSMVKTTVRTEAALQTNTSERNWEYYQRLRRENKNRYFSPEVQQQLLRDKQRLGKNFGL